MSPPQNVPPPTDQEPPSRTLLCPPSLISGSMQGRPVATPGKCRCRSSKVHSTCASGYHRGRGDYLVTVGFAAEETRCNCCLQSDRLDRRGAWPLSILRRQRCGWMRAIRCRLAAVSRAPLMRFQGAVISSRPLSARSAGCCSNRKQFYARGVDHLNQAPTSQPI
jgi:hypothetical protein